MTHAPRQVNAPGTYGKTPLMWAVEKGHADVADALIAAGALRARSHCRFVPPTHPPHTRIIANMFGASRFMKRQCDRTLGALLDAAMQPATGLRGQWGQGVL